MTARKAELSAADLRRMSSEELDRVMREGHPIDPEELDDTEYDGTSLGLPHLIERLTWTKFKKVFHRDPRTGRLRGWNCRCVQSPLSEPWELEIKKGEPISYGFYEVVPAQGVAMPRPYGAGLLIDYGRGKNGRLDPLQRVRDPIVAVNEGSSELLLGWSYLDLALKQVPTPSFFSLRRGVPLSHRARAPRDR